MCCFFKWKFPSRDLNVCPHDLYSFISLAYDKVYRKKKGRRKVSHILKKKRFNSLETQLHFFLSLFL